MEPQTELLAHKEDKTMYELNNGEAAGQTVFHFHVHVIPRYEGGPVIAGWEPGVSHS